MLEVSQTRRDKPGRSRHPRWRLRRGAQVMEDDCDTAIKFREIASRVEC